MAGLRGRTPDSSNRSALTQPELSLGSALSAFSTPGRDSIRIPSGSTAPSSAPLSTPSPPTFPRRPALDGPVFKRLSSLGPSRDADLDSAPAGVLNTPDREGDDEEERRRWADDGPNTPLPPRHKRTRSNAHGPKAPTLRDQEKQIDNLKKENFNIKLKVHFLEERLAQLAPDQIDAALRQNITLKVEVQERGRDLKKMKKVVGELEKELGTSLQALDDRDRQLSDLRRRTRNGAPAPSAVDEEEMMALREENAQLRDELDETRDVLQEHMDEKDRLQALLERQGNSSILSEGGSARREKLQRRVEELQALADDLRAEAEEQAQLLMRREEQREELLDELEAVRLELEDVQRRREAEALERSESRAQVLEAREEREAVEDDLNAIRDRLAAASIELQQKEDELDAKTREIEELVVEHERVVQVVDQEWRGEIEEAKGQCEELKDILAERDAESEQLRAQISELEANQEDVIAKFEAALAHSDREAEDKDAEIEAANAEIQRLGDQAYELEEMNERFKEEIGRVREDELVERERLEGITTALKEKCQGLKLQLEEMQELYERCTQEIDAHRQRQEELAAHAQDLVDQLEDTRTAHERAECSLDAASRAHESALRQERRQMEAKDSALQSALSDLARAQALLAQRETDLDAVQQSLQAIEAESRKAGESHTTARFSLQLEVDRLKRDAERLEDELTRVRKDLDEREGKGRDRDGVIDALHAENRELSSQLAAQTQARLNVSEKLDGVQAALKAAEAELSGFKTRVAELEQRLSKDQRSLLSAENQYRDQLTERNTLLLTIYQYMDKILGVDKTPKKGGQAETKPFTNFGVFHDNLITRLKALSQIQLEFDKRCKEAESRFTDKLVDMRKQLDVRWKQIDKFEASVKSYAETKAGWRRKLSTKEGELEALRASHSDMAGQLVGMRKPGQVDQSELRSLQNRATTAERRMNVAQNQLAAAEEKLAAVNQKTVTTDNKWEARVKEYEARLKTAEEKVKRERQGAKETHSQLESTIKRLQRDKELADKRNQHLNELVDTYKSSAAGSSTPAR